MSDSLAELLRRSADGVPGPELDVGRLVARADTRRRRHRLVAVAATTALVAAVAVGTYAVLDGRPRDLQPAPNPSPNVVHPKQVSARPLVYAEGSIVHVGDRTIDAGARVMFVDVTDDGVVFMTDANDRLWFDDGSTAEVIGVVPTPHVGTYAVHTSNPGSLVVWPDGTRGGSRLVVYDTSLSAVVARLKDPDSFVSVDQNAVFTSPAWWETPGCWIIDRRPCPHPHLFRYDVGAGSTAKITRDAFEAELRADGRMFAGTQTSEKTGTVLGRGAAFTLAGRRLVPVDDDGHDTSLTLVNGDPVELRLPVADTGAWGGFWVAQWLDDDRVVLAGYQGFLDGVGQGDSYPASFVDLMACTLPDGICRVALPRSKVPYLLTGQRNFP
jgi:hypothetical protein